MSMDWRSEYKKAEMESHKKWFLSAYRHFPRMNYYFLGDSCLFGLSTKIGLINSKTILCSRFFYVMRLALLANIIHYLLLQFLLNCSTLDCLFFKDGQKMKKRLKKLWDDLSFDHLKMRATAIWQFHHNIFLMFYIFLVMSSW